MTQNSHNYEGAPIVINGTVSAVSESRVDDNGEEDVWSAASEGSATRALLLSRHAWAIQLSPLFRSSLILYNIYLSCPSLCLLLHLCPSQLRSFHSGGGIQPYLRHRDGLSEFVQYSVIPTGKVERVS